MHHKHASHDIARRSPELVWCYSVVVEFPFKKAVILTGWLGSRLSEKNHSEPKPMVEIGGIPILRHTMKLYSFYGINEFFICCSHKGYAIQEDLSNYFLHRNDVIIDLRTSSVDNSSLSLISIGITGLLEGVAKPLCNLLGELLESRFTICLHQAYLHEGIAALHSTRTMHN